MTRSNPLTGAFASRWATTPFGALFRESDERKGGREMGDPLSVSEHHGVILRRAMEGQVASEDLSSYRVVRPGQLAANVMWLDKSGLGIARLLGYVSPAYKVFQVDKRLEPRFVNMLLRSTLYRAAFQRLGRGVRPNAQMINGNDLRALPIPVPPLTEQRSIADYLDRETAKIDTLIEKQTTMIERLRERRAAVVDVSLDSPADGRIAKLAWSCLFLNGDRGSTYPSRDDFVEDGVPFINAGHLAEGRVETSSMNYITPDHFNRMGGAKLRRGDILFCLRGSLGKCAVYEAAAPGALASSLVALRLRDRRMDRRYLLWLLSSRSTADLIELSRSGSAQPNLAVEDLREFRYRVPPLDAQREIADYLDRETAKIDALVAKVERHIELAKERRAALITAAVTGQIDVTTSTQSGDAA